MVPCVMAEEPGDKIVTEKDITPQQGSVVILLLLSDNSRLLRVFSAYLSRVKKHLPDK